MHAADPAAPRQIATAVEAGCKAICLSVGVTPFSNGTRPRPARIDWKVIDTLTTQLAELASDVMVGLRLFVPEERLSQLMLDLAEILGPE